MVVGQQLTYQGNSPNISAKGVPGGCLRGEVLNFALFDDYGL